MGCVLKRGAELRSLDGVSEGRGGQPLLEKQQQTETDGKSETSGSGFFFGILCIIFFSSSRSTDQHGRHCRCQSQRLPAARCLYHPGEWALRAWGCISLQELTEAAIQPQPNIHCKHPRT